MAWFVFCRRPRWWAVGLVLSGLLACGSQPTAPPAARPAVTVLPTPSPQPPIPDPPPAPAGTSIVLPPVPPPPPYGAAVAAHFPDPPIHFATPAFEPGRTDFTSNAELQSLLRRLLRDGRAGVRMGLLPLGHSQAGIPLEALLFSRGADLTPAALLQDGRPTVLLVGQQHGDEPATAEAMIVVAQELAGGRLTRLLEHINVIVLPRANPDGAHEGRRATASGIDLNRDHLLLRTPEAQAQARLAREYRPAVFVDAHEYNPVGRFVQKFGGVQRFDALLQYAMTPNLPPFIAKASEEWFREPLLGSLKTAGLSSEWFHTTSDDPNDKRVAMGGVQPDTARNVNGLRNAVSFLIEGRGAGLGRLHLKRRVHTQVTAIASILHSTAARADDLVKLRQYVDNDVSAQACQGEVVLEAAPTPSEYVLQTLDPLTGAQHPVTVAWDSALALRPVKVRGRPCGYWLSAAQGDAVRRLRALGAAVQQVEATGVMRGQTYNETAREAVPGRTVSLSEGGAVLRIQVQTVPTLIDVVPGSYYVPLDQPLAHLVIAALEPDTPVSYLAHGVITRVADEVRVMELPDVKMTSMP
ncbi:M14 family metallopeptidase [Piscinibacter sp.]|uniref:M14 family metallopeptidase n=1 Tax=Piscinibacter sp. TaxID=1903157 RepID=UPI002B8CD7C6|nr:M14 family metallocarboxypeptidase [Albitalea sp.]HUG21947.1 M14 family metallocarboxypeptidase [Albitalea sp.]